MNKLLNVKCPQCSIVFSYYESASRPFCSEKCKLIDLGHWFKESYVVPLKESEQTGMSSEESKSEENYSESYEENEQENYNESEYN